MLLSLKKIFGGFSRMNATPFLMTKYSTVYCSFPSPGRSNHEANNCALITNLFLPEPVDKNRLTNSDSQHCQTPCESIGFAIRKNIFKKEVSISDKLFYRAQRLSKTIEESLKNTLRENRIGLEKQIRKAGHSNNRPGDRRSGSPGPFMIQTSTVRWMFVLRNLIAIRRRHSLERLTGSKVLNVNGFGKGYELDEKKRKQSKRKV